MKKPRTSQPDLHPYHRKIFEIFRVVAFVEGVTAVALFFVAMPLKYGFDMPMAVTYAGRAHGYAFIAYVIAMIAALGGRGWSPLDWARTFAASIIPLGTFLNEPFLRRRHAAA